MPRIRILSGQHAGASLDLVPGTHSIGADHDCDITITDWTFPTLQLEVGTTGTAQARWTDDGARDATGASAGAGKSGELRGQCLADFEPCAFGDVVLCIGPADKPWPSDVQLLEAAFPPTPQRVALWAGARLRSRATSVLSGVSVLTLVVLCAIGLVGTPQAAPQPETLASLLARARQAVGRAGAARVEVQVDRAGLVVRGLVETSQQAAQVRAAVDALQARAPVTYRLGVASEIAETLRTGAGIAGAEVRHVGAGVFSLSASAPDTKAARDAVDRVAADLQPYVQRVEVTLDRGHAPSTGRPFLSLMQVDELSVVQTPDGQKHLAIVDRAPEGPGQAPEVTAPSGPQARASDQP